MRFDAPLKDGAHCMNYRNGMSLGQCAEQYRMTPACSSDHRWFYFPQMEKDEVLLSTQVSWERGNMSDSPTPMPFLMPSIHLLRDSLHSSQFDSDPTKTSRFTFHTAFSDVTQPPTLPQRQSIEVRAMAIFIEEDSTWGVFNHNLIKTSILDNIQLLKGNDVPLSLQMKLAVAV